MKDVPKAIEAVWKIESARHIAAIARVTHDIGVAEELAQDALVTALGLRPEEGIPENPGAWLMTAAKRRAIDSPKAGPTSASRGPCMKEEKMKKISCFSIVLTLFTALFAGSASGQQVPSQGALDDLVKMYCAAWNEPDAQHRRELLEKVWASEGTYTDPQSYVEGREALVEHIGRFLKNSAGARIIQSSRADFHHGMFRFAWKFVGGDGKTVMEGIDFGVLGADGKLQRIVGFFGPSKPL